MKKFWLKFLAGIFLIVLFLGAFFLIWLINILKELPTPEELFFASHQLTQSSKIYDREGKVLLYEIYGEEKRTVIPFEEIPDYVKKATIAIEDQNFYQHKAIDIRSIIRALIINLIKGKIVQGGSTITQQLVKNAFLSPEKTFKRKIKELILAYWIEKKYSKDEILSLYLNQISYGANAYGIEAAAQIYFSKPAKELTLAEAALLAALPKAPTYYSPWGPHLDELLERKNYILKQMLELGFIDKEEYQRAKKYQYKFSSQKLGSIKAPHFVLMVKEYLVNKYGEEFLKKGGLKIITTLDYQLQEIAEKVVKEGAKRNEEIFNGKNAALVAQDPKTGEILALVGSRDYFDKENEGNFNVASQGLRQPGSAFKPFAYLALFKKGYPPNTIIFDLPTEFVPNNPDCPLVVDYTNQNEKCYHPQNYNKRFKGPITLKEALAQSINVPAIKVLYLAGLEETLSLAKKLGITTLKDPNFYGLSLVLGGGEVKLIDLVNAYSVFAAEGIKHNQKIILKIEDSEGNLIEEVKDFSIKVVEPNYVRILNDVLSDEIIRRPLYGRNYYLTLFDDYQVAIKTGTSDDRRDAWTIGYTPFLVVGVWAGNNHQEPMKGGSVTAALPIWSKFFKEALKIKQYPIEVFNKPIIEKIDKPMLNGNYFSENNEIHNILYYVDKNNPLGDRPNYPEKDPQFINWEIPVRNWLEKNFLKNNQYQKENKPESNQKLENNQINF